jgi:hypothetical protein
MWPGYSEEVTPNPQHLTALRNLLSGLFQPGELHRLLNTLTIPGAQLYADLSQDLPPHEHAAPNNYFFQAARLLLHRKMVTEAFFNLLLGERPFKATEIQATQNALFFAEESYLQKELGARQQENPFVPYAPFVGRQYLIEKIEQKLSRGQSTLLIGGRRAGKTALLEQLSADRVGVIWCVSTSACGTSWKGRLRSCAGWGRRSAGRR